MASVVAKPLTALDPKNMSTRAAIIVVILASRMVQKAFANPAVTAFFGGVSARSSSLILSKMITLASTAIPTERIRPAMPVRVRVEPKPPRVATIISRFTISAKSAIRPQKL